MKSEPKQTPDNIHTCPKMVENEPSYFFTYGIIIYQNMFYK